MKYKNIEIELDLKLYGVKKGKRQLLYSYIGTMILDQLIKTLDLLKTWFPKDNRTRL